MTTKLPCFCIKRSGISTLQPKSDAVHQILYGAFRDLNASTKIRCTASNFVWSVQGSQRLNPKPMHWRSGISKLQPKSDAVHRILVEALRSLNAPYKINVLAFRNLPPESDAVHRILAGSIDHQQ